MRYSSALGNFHFEDGTRPSTARLIRDTVTGQWFNPKPDGPKLKNEGDCVKFVRSLDSKVLADTPFQMEVLV